jgi:hypothetical protein
VVGPVAQAGVEPFEPLNQPIDRDRTFEVDRQTGGQAPVVLPDECPGHHLVEDRAENSAVGDPVPAFEAAFEEQVAPRSIRLDVQLELHAVCIERTAGEAIVSHAEGSVARVRRRLVETNGTIQASATGELLATAEATYIAAREGRKRELQARHGFRRDPDGLRP